MRYHPASNGLWAFLVVLSFAILSNCYRNGEKALVLRPSHRARNLNRASPDPVAAILDKDHDSPAAYDFGNPGATSTSAAAYPLPTASASDPFSASSSTLDGHSPTATTEPRSPGISNSPVIESTSAVPQKSSNGEKSSSLVISSFDSSQDPASQTATTGNVTVTVTVTNLISGEPTHTETKYPVPSSDVQTSFISSASPTASDSDVSVITITSLHTITLSIGRNSSSTEKLTLPPLTSQQNVTSTVRPTSSQNVTSAATSSGPLTSSGVSIITITRTETYTGMPNTTADATGPLTSKEVTTSTITIDRPSPISHIPPFSASFNLSSVPGPVVSSQVSGAVTSLHPDSSSDITRTVFQNITVTLSELPETESRETEATRTALSTYPVSSNTTKPFSSTEILSTLHPVPTSTGSRSTIKSEANTTVAETPGVSISTEVVTITVYPTPSETTGPRNRTSVVTLHSSSTTTVTVSLSPLSNASSSVFPTTGLTTASSSLFTTGSADGWSTSLSTASANSGVIGTMLNTTTTRAPTDNTQPTDVSTTCEHTSTMSQSAATTGTSTTSSSSSSSTGLNGTATYSVPSTFRTTVSPTSSAEDDGTSAYPSPSGKRLPGNPSYPWGGSGPLHRLHQEPDF